MVGEPVLARVRHQGSETFEERERVEDEMRRAVAPRTAELVDDPTVG